MEEPRVRLVLLPGGRHGDESAGEGLPRQSLRIIRGGRGTDVAAAIQDAIEAARRMRAEIEERIARAFDAFDERK